MPEDVGTAKSDVTLNPIFVVGYDRSGTTMLGSMLGAHPDAFCGPESHFVGTLAPAAPALSPAEAERLADRLTREFRFRLWCRMGASPPAPPWPATYAEFMRRIAESLASRFGKAGARFWVNHTPKHVLFLDRLFLHFPDAKVIHIVRDGRATAASLMPLDWGPNDPVEAAKRWAERVRAGLAAERRFGPDRIARVRYEDLVGEPEAEIRRLLAFVGLDFVRACLAGDKSAIPGYSATTHELVGTAPVAARADAWRRKLGEREVELFESVCGDLLETLGYTRVHDRPRRVTPMETARYAVRHFFASRKNKAARKVRQAKALDG